MKNLRAWQGLAFLFLCTLYGLLVYFIMDLKQGIDFASFYSSAQLITMGENPYQQPLATYFPTSPLLALNLNPPILLLLFNPFVQLPYKAALFIWWLFSMLFRIIGAGLVCQHILGMRFFKKNWLSLYLLYFSLFSTLMDAIIGQLGGLLLFFIMLGYHFYSNFHDYKASIVWGIIAAAKIFPGLLLFYVLLQKRYKVFWSMLAVSLLLTFIPAVMYGPSIYSHYFDLLSKVYWYPDNWNASLLGFLFRFSPYISQLTSYDKVIITLFYMLSSAFFLLWYAKIVKQLDSEKQAFGFTLVMMLFLSPFGWLYYFSLLIYPLLLSWLILFKQERNLLKEKLLWFVSFFLLNFPMAYVRIRHKEFNSLFFYSFYFFGLLLLLFLFNLIRGKTYKLTPHNTSLQNLSPIITMLLIGFIIPLLYYGITLHLLSFG